MVYFKMKYIHLKQIIFTMENNVCCYVKAVFINFFCALNVILILTQISSKNFSPTDCYFLSMPSELEMPTAI